MSTIQDIQSNIKLNLNYIINADDNFKVIISKIIQKLKDNDVVIKNKGYEILDFKETFLNITTANAISLKKLEDIYGIHNNYEIGVKLRQGILVAREITRYSTFNFFYLLKIAELFDIGKVVDIVNDKKKHLITIKITSDTNNGVNVEKFLEHLNELGPAIYSYKVEQVS